MRHRRLIVVAAVALAIGGWAASDRLWRPSPRPVAWHDLTAALPRLETPRLSSHAFRTRAALAGYLAHVMPGGHVVAPRIDFGRDEAFFVTAGPRSSTGYRLQIVRVTDQGGHVVVLVREQTPTLGTGVRARLTYPFKLITIPQTAKPVYARFEGRP